MITKKKTVVQDEFSRKCGKMEIVNVKEYKNKIPKHYCALTCNPYCALTPKKSTKLGTHIIDSSCCPYLIDGELTENFVKRVSHC